MNIKQAVAEVRDANNSVNWVVVSFDGRNFNFHSTGTGLQSFQAAFQDDSIQFGLIEVVAVDTEIEANSSINRPQYVQVNWIGNKAPAFKKVASLDAQVKNQVAMYFQEVAVRLDVQASPREVEYAIGANNIVSEILKALGRHKVSSRTYFNFGDSGIEVSELVNRAS